MRERGREAGKEAKRERERERGRDNLLSEGGGKKVVIYKAEDWR